MDIINKLYESEKGIHQILLIWEACRPVCRKVKAATEAVFIKDLLLDYPERKLWFQQGLLLDGRVLETHHGQIMVKCSQLSVQNHGDGARAVWKLAQGWSGKYDSRVRIIGACHDNFREPMAYRIGAQHAEHYFNIRGFEDWIELADLRVDKNGRQVSFLLATTLNTMFSKYRKLFLSNKGPNSMTEFYGYTRPTRYREVSICIILTIDAGVDILCHHSQYSG